MRSFNSGVEFSQQRYQTELPGSDLEDNQILRWVISQRLQPLAEIRGVNLQLMSIRIQEIERLALAPVLLPALNPGCLKPLHRR
jgi:hypothetical protein